jgi:hypothetical protein
MTYSEAIIFCIYSHLNLHQNRPMTCSMICVIGCIEEDFNDGYAYVANSYSRTVDSPIVRGSVCCLFCGRDHIIGLRMSSRPER